MTSGKILEIRGLKKSFGTGENMQIVLDGLDFELFRGDMAAVRGQSGSGKSTLLNIIGTLDRADSGSINAAGCDLMTMNESEQALFRRKKAGFIFQNHCLLPQLTTIENVLLPTLAENENTKESLLRAEELLKKVGLEKRMHSFPAQMSGGERQRTSIARALINTPEILLADEPTGALDSKNTASLLDLLCGLNSEGMTILMVTHSDFAASRTKRVFTLENGQISEG